MQKILLKSLSYFMGILACAGVFSMLSTDLGYRVPEAKANGATDAMMVYDNQDITSTPKYRIWDGSSWGSEQDASTITGDIAHMEVQYSPTRDEAIMVIQSTTGEISAQVFDGTSWGSKSVFGTISGNGVGADQQASNGRCFDFFYEQVSGDAIAVYCDNSADPDYRVWNGSSWSSASDINIPTTGIVSAIEVSFRPGADEGAFITNDASSDVYGMRWTGSAWSNMGTATTWETSGSVATKKPIGVAFEKTSGDIMFAWGFATVATAHFRYRTYTQSNSTLNAVTNVTNGNNGGVVHWLQMAADPAASSDKIMIGLSDAGADLNTFEWSGSAWSAVHTEHSGTTEDIVDKNFDIIYETHASNSSDLWLTFGNSATVTRKKYESTGTWGTSTTAGDDTAFTNIIAQPNNGAVLAAAYQDNSSATDDIQSFQLTGGGTTWSSPATVWSGPVARNLGFFRLDMAAQAYNSSNEAIMVYDTQDLTSVPKYRQWTGSSWGSEQSATTVDGEIAHIALKFSPTKNEGLLVTQSTTGKIQSQTWNGSSWSSVTTFITVTGNGVGADQKALNGQAFDIAYEATSGDAVVLYADDTADPNYRTWNGTSWSGETNLDVPTTGVPNAIELTRKDGTDEMSMILIDVNIDIYGMRWTGSAWDNMGAAAAWDTTASLATKHPMDVAYESSSGDALFLWGDTTSTDYYYRTYSGGSLSAATLLDVTASGGVGHWVTLESDPNSDKIMMGSLDAGADLNTVEWSGTAWGTPHAEHSAGTEDVLDRNFDMVYETHASNSSDLWLSYGNSATVTRKKFESTGTWGTSTTTGDDTAFIDMEAHPVTGAILTVAYQDNASATDDIQSFELTGGGTTWSSNATIWGGPVARNAGFDRVDIETEKYVIPPVDVSGVCKAYNQTTDCTDTGEIKVAVNGALQAQTQATVAGTWSVTGLAIVSGDIVTVFIDAAADADEAIAVTKYGGSGNITGVNLFKEHLTLGSNQDNTLTATDLGNYDNSVSADEDIFFEVNTATSFACNGGGMFLGVCIDNIAQSSQEKLYIDSGDTFAPAVNVRTHDMQIAGTFTGDASVYTVEGSWSDTGTFTSSTSTVNFASTSTGETIITSGSAFNNVKFTGMGGGWTLQDNATVAGEMDIVYGNFNAGSGTTLTFTASGTPFMVNDTFTPGTSTVVFTNATSASVPGATFYNLSFAPSAGTPTYAMGSAMSWSTSYDTAANQINELAVDIINGVVYAAAGNSDIIYRCIVTTNCDASGDWTESFNNSSESEFKSIEFDRVRNALYAGSAANGKIFKCDTATSCDANSDWVEVADTDATNVLGLEIDYANNRIYAATGTGSDADVFACSLSTACDANGEWLKVLNTASKGYMFAITIDDEAGVIYAGLWWPNAQIYRCAVSSGCDADGDWTLALDYVAEGEIRSLTYDATNNVMYAGTGGGGIILRCPTSSSCDATGDWAVGFDSASSSTVLSLLVDQTSGRLLAGTALDDFVLSCPTSSSCDATGDFSQEYDPADWYVFDLEKDKTSSVIYAGSGDSGRIYRGAYLNSDFSVTNNFTINSGATVTAPNSGTLTIGGNFTNGGTFTAGSGTVVFNDNTKTSTLSGSTTFNNLTVTTAGKDLLFTSGQTFAVNGALTLTGATGAGNELTLNSTTGSSSWTINTTGLDSASVTYATVTWSACSVATPVIDMSGAGNTNGGNNGACWSFPASGVTISGTVYLSDNTTADLTSRSVKLSINGGTAQVTTSDNGSGGFSFTTPSTPTAGDVLTIWLNGESSKATSVIKYGASCVGYASCTDLRLITDHVFLADFQGTDLTNSDLSACDNTTGTGCATTDIGFDNVNGLTLSPGRSLFVRQSTNFTPGGSVKIPVNTVLEGTFNAPSSGKVTIGGDLTLIDGFAFDGVYNASTGTTEFDDSSLPSIISGPSDFVFHNFLVDTPSKTITFGANTLFTINGSLTVVGGANNEVYFTSSGAGSSQPWQIDLNGSASISRLVVAWGYCEGTSKNIVLSPNSTNGGNNESCWVFTTASSVGGGGGSSGGGAGSGSSGGGGGGAGSGSVQATATATMLSGSITTITVDNGGSGYTTAPSVCIQGGGFSVQATATATLSNGIIISITVNEAGSGYQTTPTVGIWPSPGDAGPSCSSAGGGGGQGGGGGGGSP